MDVDIHTARTAIEHAFRRFGSSKALANANEATTRCELIDKVLAAVGWTGESIVREYPSGVGDFLDYELRLRGSPWLVLEAKRVGETFALDGSIISTPGSGLKPITMLLQTGGENLRKVMKQAARYCNDRATPYACATNGHQWIFFRGLSGGEKHPWAKGRALVFAGTQAILDRFDEFFSCIAHSAARVASLPRLLEQPSSAELPAPLIP